MGRDDSRGGRKDDRYRGDRDRDNRGRDYSGRDRERDYSSGYGGSNRQRDGGGYKNDYRR